MAHSPCAPPLLLAALHRAYRLAFLCNGNSYAHLLQSFAEIAHAPVTSRHDVPPKGRFQLVQRALDELVRVCNHAERGHRDWWLLRCPPEQPYPGRHGYGLALGRHSTDGIEGIRVTPPTYSSAVYEVPPGRPGAVNRADRRMVALQQNTEHFIASPLELGHPGLGLGRQ